MHEIKVADLTSKEYKLFREWILNEWDRVDQLHDVDAAYDVPLPLLSFDGEHLSGGLSFIRFKSPVGLEDALWINTVYVHGKYRGRKVAQALISHAEKACSKAGYKRLHVYTDKPNLYLRLGWRELENYGENYILVKKL